MMKAFPLIVLLLGLPIYPQTPITKPKPFSSVKQSKVLKYEIEDLIPERRRFIHVGNESSPTMLDAWALLPDTPLVLTLPKGIHVIEQVRRVIAWEYKFSKDREMYKAEYMALIGDPKKWITYISDNVDILISGAQAMRWDAVHAVDREKLEAGRKLEKIAEGYLMNNLYWQMSIDPKWAADVIKKNKEEVSSSDSQG